MGNLNVASISCEISGCFARGELTIMADSLRDFKGKDCAFVASWLQKKGLNKVCAVFEGI